MEEVAETQKFVCPVCAETHVVAMAYSVKYPHAAKEIPAEEIERRVVITEDQCILDSQRFYLRGRIPIPVQDPENASFLDDPFVWGVWAEVSPKTFKRANEIWNAQGRENEPIFRGYLDNELPIYGPTLNLELDVQTEPLGWRPSFFVLDPEHTLAIEQRDGLSMARLQEITVLMNHPQRDLGENED